MSPQNFTEKNKTRTQLATELTEKRSAAPDVTSGRDSRNQKTRKAENISSLAETQSAQSGEAKLWITG